MMLNVIGRRLTGIASSTQCPLEKWEIVAVVQPVVE